MKPGREIPALVSLIGVRVGPIGVRVGPTRALARLTGALGWLIGALARLTGALGWLIGVRVRPIEAPVRRTEVRVRRIGVQVLGIEARESRGVGRGHGVGPSRRGPAIRDLRPRRPTRSARADASGRRTSARYCSWPRRPPSSRWAP
jgi:hypothetical protein